MAACTQLWSSPWWSSFLSKAICLCPWTPADKHSLGVRWCNYRLYLLVSISSEITLPLLSAFWCFKLLPHIFCLGISVCFVTVAKRANAISVKYVLVNQKGSPQTPSLSQKKVWLGQEASPRSEVVHKLCWRHLSGLRFDRVVPDTTQSTTLIDSKIKSFFQNVRYFYFKMLIKTVTLGIRITEALYFFSCLLAFQDKFSLYILAGITF